MVAPLVAVLNGPNLNMLGLRQPQIYGAATLDDIEQLCAETAEGLDLAIDFRQTNGEGELISWVQECRGRAQGIVINPAGYSHTSVALLDALLSTELPVIEVHISNIHRREQFRHHSYVSTMATGVLCGSRNTWLRPGIDRDGPAAGGSFMSRLSFEPEDIRELAAILDETGLTEIEIAEKDRRIRIVRTPATVAMHHAPVAAAPPPAPVAVPPRALPETIAEPEVASPGRRRQPHGGHRLSFAPSLRRPPFVTLGQRVEAGQTLLIIEAMKTMNQIKAPQAPARSPQILVADGAAGGIRRSSSMIVE